MRKNVEPLVLVIALVILALGAALLAYLYPSVADITTVGTPSANGTSAMPLKTEEVHGGIASWFTPATWVEPASHSRLFESDKFLFYPVVYPNGDFVKRVNHDTRSPSGIPLDWYTAHKLDFTDGGIDRSDRDGDGMSVMTEFKNEPVGTRLKAADLDGTKSTDPSDPQSHPEFLSRLRLKEYELKEFRIQFKGYQQLNGIYLFQLYLRDVDSSKQPPLKKTGDDLGVEGYVIGPFHQEFKDVMDPGTKSLVHKDVSTLELDRPDIGLKVVVPFREEINSPDSTADFIMLMPTEAEKVIKIATGKTFSIPFAPDTTYLVLSADEKGATIRDTKTGKVYQILKLDPAEWDEVPRAPASKQP